jgi:hypothetical protein
MSSIEVFCCYAHEDAPLLENLKAHLTLLKRQGLITVWADTNISPGSNWEQEIEKHLNAANIILLLVSADFMASDYCYSKEMFRAVERHDRGEAIVIPIILRPVYWQGAPFARLQALPTGAKPIISSIWYSLDEALLDVVNGIGRAIKYFQTTTSVRNSQLREYVFQEIRKGRPISEVLKEYDPSLDTLFQTIIEAAVGRISEVIRMGKPTRNALKDCSPGLEYLFEVAVIKYSSESSDSVLQARIEKLLMEISPAGDGDLRVQAEVTPDTFGVLADSFNYMVELLASLIIRVQRTTAAVSESTTDLLHAMQAQRQAVGSITHVVKDIASSATESMKYDVISTQAKQLDDIMVSTVSQAERIRKLMDKLYASVSDFQLPQNVSAACSPLFDTEEDSQDQH